MITRYLADDETDMAAWWCCKWADTPDEAHMKAHRMFFPDMFTLGTFGDDGEFLAAGGIFIPASGEVGFAGPIVTNPEMDRIRCGAAIRNLIQGMKDEMFRLGMKAAVSMFDERPLAEIFSDGDIHPVESFMSYSFRR